MILIVNKVSPSGHRTKRSRRKSALAIGSPRDSAPCQIDGTDTHTASALHQPQCLVCKEGKFQPRRALRLHISCLFVQKGKEHTIGIRCSRITVPWWYSLERICLARAWLVKSVLRLWFAFNSAARGQRQISESSTEIDREHWHKMVADIIRFYRETKCRSRESDLGNWEGDHHVRGRLRRTYKHKTRFRVKKKKRRRPSRLS
jgi:hypothetical protein